MSSAPTFALAPATRGRGIGVVLICIIGLLPRLARAQQPAPAPPTAVGCETLTGLVTDEKKQPLTGATVEVQGINDAFSTNSEGRYIVVPRNRGTFARNARVQVSAVGYTTRTFTLVNCQLADVTLQTLPGTRFRRNGRIKKTATTGKIK